MADITVPTCPRTDIACLIGKPGLSIGMGRGPSKSSGLSQ
jgi:hypothetical protein